MRRLSLNARLAQEAGATDDLEVVLLHIEHPDLDEPLRLSSDNAERLSVEPIMYCTRSTWLTPDGKPFLFIIMDALVPDETDDAPASGSMVIEVLDSRIAETLTATTERATVSMAVVMASSPNTVEAEWLGMKLTSVDGDSGQIAFSFTMEPIYDEPFPTARMTKERFPGMHV